MSLDEPSNHKFAAMMESPDHPGWREVAAKQRAEERARAKAEYEEREATESIEAMESHWAGVFAAMPDEVRNARYRDERAGIDPRMIGPHG